MGDEINTGVDTSGAETPSVGDSDGVTGTDTSGAETPSVGDSSGDLYTYLNVVEVKFRTTLDEVKTALLRSFRVVESDLSGQDALLRRIEGTSVIAAPDGGTVFVCHLVNVVSIQVRHSVTISYRFD